MTKVSNSPMLLGLAAFTVLSGCVDLQAAADPAAPGTATQTQLAWSTLNFRAGAVGGEFDSYGDVFAPVWQDDKAVVFLQPWSRNTTGTDTDSGAGIGLRRLIDDDWAVGLNAFYDHSWYRGGNRFDVNQFGTGVEVIGTWLDFRANYYLPQTREHVTDRQRIGTRVQALGDPYGVEHRVAQDLQWLGINREQVAAAGQGWDAELGLLVPWLDRWVETWAYLGGYWYANRAGPDLKGLKARAEARLTRWLYADAGWIEDKEVAGGTWFAGFRVSLPLGKPPGPPPAGELTSSLHYRSVALRAKERMNGSVERNSRAVISTRTSRTTETVLADRKSVTLYDDVVFVDGRLGTPGGPGTFERPSGSIQGGVDRSAAMYGDRGTVFVQGRPSAYAESVNIGSGVQLFGSGLGLPVTSPATGAVLFHGRTKTAPLVTGGFLAHDIAGPVGIAGFEFTGGLVSSWVSATGRPASATNIFLENVGSAVIQDNHIHNTRSSISGIYIEANGTYSSEVLLRRNEIHDNVGVPPQGFQGVVLSTSGSARLNATLIENTISRSGADGLAVATFDTSTINAVLSANVFSFNGTDQIVALNFGGTLKFVSAGTLSNTLLESPGAHSLYEFFVGSPQGTLLINDTLQPADTNLP